MTIDDREIVAAIRGALIARIGAERYELWFEEGQVRWEISPQRIELWVDKPFIRDRIRSLFWPDLQAALATVFNDGAGELVIHSGRDATGDAPPPPRRRRRGGASTATATASSGAAPARRARSRRAGSGRGGDGPQMPQRIESLESFVVCDSNKLAFSGAEMVLERPGVWSPLMLHGPPGSGKSHLLKGIQVRGRQLNLRTVLLSAEQFTREFLQALHGSGLPSFRQRCRNVDMLLVDDVQFLEGKQATRVELLHTLDALLRNGKQLVLTADRTPAELSAWGADLATRTASGMVCGVEPPGAEARRTILEQLNHAYQAQLPGEVLDLIAEHLHGDPRQLFGAVSRLLLTVRAYGRPMTCEVAREALADLFQTTQRVVRLSDIEQAICEVFGLDRELLQSSKRTNSVNRPRMIAMWLARKYTGAPFAEIGQYFGRRSHSTAISAGRKVAKWRQENASVPMTHGTCGVNDAIRRIESVLHSA